MKKTITLLALGAMLIGSTAKAQAPAWSLAQRAGGSAADACNAVVTDAGGNFYLTGYFNSSQLALGTTLLNNTGGLDMYVVKYDPSGNVIWAKSSTGSGNDVGYSLTVDATGNVYVVGSSNSNNLMFGSVGLSAHGYDDVFVVKYDPSGNVLWAKAGGGINDDLGESVAVDASGNVYITGIFASHTINFSGTVLTTNGGNNDVFLVKYNSGGTLVWAKNFGGYDDEGVGAVTLDATGNPYLTGSYLSPKIGFGTDTLVNGGGLDLFTVKLDPSGNTVWAKTASGTLNDVGYDIKVDASGNVHVVGTFNSHNLTFGTTVLATKGNDDIFVLKYDPSGNVLWAKSLGGNGDDIGKSISLDANGNSLIAGYYASTSMLAGTTTLTNAGTNNLYLAGYDGSGNVLWAKSAGGSGSADDRANSICTDGFGNAFVGGYFTSPTLTLGATPLANAGVMDIFVAKVLSGAAGIEENQLNEASIRAYPNPGTGLFMLQLNGFQEGSSEAQLSVVNVLGQEVYKALVNIHTSGNPISLSAQPDGLYYLILTRDNKQYQSKVILSHQ